MGCFPDQRTETWSVRLPFTSLQRGKPCPLRHETSKKVSREKEKIARAEFGLIWQRSGLRTHQADDAWIFLHLVELGVGIELRGNGVALFNRLLQVQEAMIGVTT